MADQISDTIDVIASEPDARHPMLDGAPVMIGDILVADHPDDPYHRIEFHVGSLMYDDGRDLDSEVDRGWTVSPISIEFEDDAPYEWPLSECKRVSAPGFQVVPIVDDATRREGRLMTTSELSDLADRLEVRADHVDEAIMERAPAGLAAAEAAEQSSLDLRAAARALREAGRPRGAAFENTERDRLAWRDRAWKAESELDAALAEVERLREGIREHKHDALCNGPLFAKERIEALWALLDTPEVTS